MNTNENERRRRTLAIWSAARAEELREAVSRVTDLGAVEDLKKPETGLVMLRGRIGGDGALFNIGEATITRAVVRLKTGEIGYGVRLGRSAAAARDAAILDALWQSPHTRPHIEARVLQPISGRLQADRAVRSSPGRRHARRFFYFGARGEMRFTGPQPVPAARGFANPVLDAQATFRSVLSALAEPGTLHSVATPMECCPGFSPAMTALALTLADFETRLWLDAGSQGAAAAYLRFQTGAPVTTSAIDATFAFITDPATMLRLSAFAQGSLEYPDASCTIVIDVRAIETTRGFQLKGPGIPDARRLHVAPLPHTFAADVAANRTTFPLGVDLLFCQDTLLAALPRSTVVTGSTDD